MKVGRPARATRPLTNSARVLSASRYGWWAVVVGVFAPAIILRDPARSTLWGLTLALIAVLIAIRFTAGSSLQSFHNRESLVTLVGTALEPGEEVTVCAIASWRYAVALTDGRLVVLSLAHPYDVVLGARLDEVVAEPLRRRPLADSLNLRVPSQSRTITLDFVSASRPAGRAIAAALASRS